MAYQSVFGFCLGLSLLFLPMGCVSADDAFQWQVSAGAFNLDPGADSDVIYASGMPVPGAKFDVQDITDNARLVSRKLANDWSLQMLLSQPANLQQPYQALPLNLLKQPIYLWYR